MAETPEPVRCWPTTDPLYIAYHDDGSPLPGFEAPSLECHQCRAHLWTQARDMVRLLNG